LKARSCGPAIDCRTEDKERAKRKVKTSGLSPEGERERREGGGKSKPLLGGVGPCSEPPKGEGRGIRGK